MSSEDDRVQRELFGLLESHRDGVLGAEERERLNALLRSSAEARRVFLEEGMVETLLASKLETSAPSSGQDGKNSRRRPLLLASVAALCACLLVGLMMWPFGGDRERQTVGLVEHAGDAAFQKGDGLRRGSIQLGETEFQFRLEGGARILVEGPAAFEILGPDDLSLEHGRLRVILDDPSGNIKVKTDKFEVRDLGTEFVIELAPEGDGGVHVLDGKVMVSSDGSPRKITAGHGLAIRAGKIDGEIEAQPDRFSAFFPPPGRHDRWLKTTEDLITNDARLIAVYDFENPTGELADRSGNGNGGKIVDASTTTGRWRGKGALGFTTPGARIPIDISGQHKALTLSAWVKFDSVTEQPQALLMSNGFEPIFFHWQVSDHGVMNLRTGLPRKKVIFANAPLALDSGELGRWHHVAATIDGSSGVICLYLDGEKLIEKRSPHRGKLKIGRATIGNWNPTGRVGHPHAQRPLGGAIDEMIIWNVALESHEIRRLFEIGRP